MELPNPSKEQHYIIEQVKNNNLIIEAVAGSGKTTTSLMIAKKYPEKKILLLTYSSKLKNDTRIKVKEFSMYNMEVQSFNSFAYKYYTTKASHNLNEAFKIKKPIKSFLFDIIIIDEIQDMDERIYKLSKKIFK